MDAVEYLKIKKQICKKASCCSECLINVKSQKLHGCNKREFDNPEEAVAIIEKWAAEHPVKTRQSEFLKMFPNVRMCYEVIALNPCDLDTGYEHPKGCYSECGDCRQDYWLAEVEDN